MSNDSNINKKNIDQEQTLNQPLILAQDKNATDTNTTQEEVTGEPLISEPLILPQNNNMTNTSAIQEEATSEPLIFTQDKNITHTNTTQEEVPSESLIPTDTSQASTEQKKENKTKKKTKWSIFLKFFLSFAILGIILGTIIAFALYKWASGDLPSFSRIADYRPAQATTVLARDGSLIGQFYREKRYVITLEEMSPHVPLAFLAVEDAQFYEHPGINLTAIMRAFFANLQSGTIRQGGSTITQQVVKRLMLTPERSYERKLKEAILAFRLEQQLSKDDILTIYLNQIFLGSNAYGIEAAARTYFGKHAINLSIAEAAMLAGLPQSPSANNPYRHPVAAKDRQEHVLRRMRTLGWITDEEFDKAFYEELEYKTMPTFMGREGGWYLEEVRRQLIALFNEQNSAQFGFDSGFYGEDVVYEMGLTVHTSMDPIQQNAADEALRNGLRAATKRHGWLGPIQEIPASQITAYLEEHPLDITRFEKNEWEKAVILKVSKNGAQVRIGEYKGFISVKTMGWARKPNKELSGLWQSDSTKDARRVLKTGDLVWVSLDLPTQKEIDKLKKSNPKRATIELSSLAELSLEKIIPLALEQYPTVQGAIVSIEPQTGDVVALVGGYEFSYDGDQFNRATQANRQPGSAFKPIVYSAAIDHGFTAGSLILDAPIVLIDEYTHEVWRPSNYGGVFEGPIRLNRALARSRNLCTIRVVQETGIEAILNRAYDLGFKNELSPTLATSLGTGVVLPIDLTSIYTAFAYNGQRAIPRFIQKVQGPWGNTIYEQAPQHETAISPQNAFVMAKLLQGVVEYGTATKAKILKKIVAGKTGTTNDEIDAWFIGFTPDLVTGTYIGYDFIEPMGRGETGTSAALPIYIDYAKKALEHYPVRDFDKPEGIYFSTIDGISVPFYSGTSVTSGINAVQGSNNEETKNAEDLLTQGF